MRRESQRPVVSISDQEGIELMLELGHGLQGISQSTWQKISERMEPFDAAKGRFHLRVARVEFSLVDGCVLSTLEVRQLLRLCGGFVPLCLLSPER